MIEKRIGPSTNSFYVACRSTFRRKKLLDYLEAQGFGYEEWTNREDILSSTLPVVVCMDERTVCCMGNVTVAACASSRKHIIEDDEFYRIYQNDFATKK